MNNNNNKKKRYRDNFEKDNNNNNSFNNSDNNNNKNDHINKLYSSVFQNKYLRKIIFNHLNKFNILLSVNIDFKSLEEWQEFKYKQYLNKVTLDFKDKNFDLHELPENIKHITIKPPCQINDKEYEIISVPDHIVSVSYTGPIEALVYINLYQQPYSSKIFDLSVNWYEMVMKKPSTPNLPSITNLTIYGDVLPSNSMLPPSLKKLSIYDLEFENDSLHIESLTSLYLENSPVIYGLSTSNCINLVKLEFSDRNASINNDVQLPDSIQDLIIECYSFNSKLPSCLKSFDLDTYIYTNPIQFPASLEQLVINFHSYSQFKKDLIQNRRQALPPNLKSLDFQCSSIVDNNGQSILPEKLKKLSIWCDFNQELKVNQLPTSLTHLDLGADFNLVIDSNLLPSSLTRLDLGESYNQVIDVNVLPANLNYLVLGCRYSQIINPLAIPQQLKLLKIYNENYPHPIKLTPSTHPNTVIKINDINLYYQPTSSEFNELRVLRLPARFSSSLSTLRLQNKSNLEYLHLGLNFNHPIELSDLPTPNNIKTLVCSDNFDQTINLEHFQNLESIIIQEIYSTPKIITNTTTIDDQQQEENYNNYKLKNIITSPNNIQFLKQLDINFYQFIKYNNKNK